MSVKRYIGTKQFYKTILTLALPIMIQNAVTNFVSLLDNLMIGRIGTNALSGVAIANQLMFVYFLVIFGATAGTGIFTAQFYGNGDNQGVRYTFRFKIMLNLLLTLGCIAILYFNSESLIGLFLKGDGKPEDAAETLAIGTSYLKIMLAGLIPIGICNAYSGTLRDVGQTKVPMMASVIAIFINLAGNFILIYGYLGFPRLEADGAAIATVISRFVELLILVIYTGVNKVKYPFIIGAFESLRVPLKLVKTFILKSMPLMMNETLWAVGMTVINQCYSYRSLDAVAALNIETTIWNVLGVAFLAMGEAVGIIVGQILGRGQIEEAKDTADKLIVFTVVCGVIFGFFMIAISPLFPLVYNTSDSVRALATKFIFIYGVLMPLYAYTHAAYFTIRSGGRTGVTMIFDSCFVWCISVPTAFCLSHFTGMSIELMVWIVQGMEIVKCIIGGVLIKSGIWARKLVG